GRHLGAARRTAGLRTRPSRGPGGRGRHPPGLPFPDHSRLHGGRRGRARRALHRLHEPVARRAGAGEHRGGFVAHRLGVGGDDRVAGQAGLRAAPHGGGGPGGPANADLRAARPGAGPIARQEGRVAGAARRLHPPRLRAAGAEAERQPRRVRRLVLPLPRQPLRHVGPHPEGAGAGQPRRARLRLHLRHPDPHRL
ncbi:MAG: Ubiquinol-cytochrome C reductase iron-sulfur subunit, partial [uncultured Acetobacteraceae bacterium]